MSNTKGIKETKEGLAFFGALITGIAAAASDGKFEWLSDTLKFRGAAMLLPTAVTGSGEIPAELADLQEDEAIDAKLALAEELDLPDDLTEELVEEGADLGLRLLAYVNKIRNAKAEAEAA